MFLIGGFGFLGIGGHSLKIRLNDLPDTSFICVPGDLGRACFALSQRFSETLESEIRPGTLLIALSSASAIAKQVDYCFGGVVDAYSHAFDHSLCSARG